MDKAQAAKALHGIAEILAIEGFQPYKVMAYKKAAAAIEDSPFALEDILTRPHAVRGVGPDTRALIRVMQTGGVEKALQHLNVSLPFTVRELIRVPGIGPKTAHTLYHNHGITSLNDLQAALRSDKLRHMPGFGIHRLERMKRDVAVLAERRQLLPIALVWPLATEFRQILRNIPGVTQAAITGSARRLAVTAPRIELVVALRDEAPFREWCVRQNATPERDYLDLNLNLQDEKVPIRIYPVKEERFAETLMKTTGDSVHQAVMEGLLQQNNYRWTADGILDAHGQAVAVDTEEELYDLVQLLYFPPELREGKGLLCAPESLIKPSDIRGDLHVHSSWSDGSLTIREVVSYAERMGYEYVAITDHSQSLSIAGGLSPDRLRAQRAEMDEVRKTAGIRILHGIEVDILADGTLDLPDDVLWDLDIVVASVHSSMHQSKAQMTERIIRAIQHPSVDILGHPTGRVIGRRAGYELDIERVISAAAQRGVAVELNANPNRLDLFDEWLRFATESGVWIAVDTDTHHLGEMEYMAYGIRMAHRGWLRGNNVLNTLPYSDLIRKLHRCRASI